VIVDSYRDAIREISGVDPGDDPEKWKEWLEKQRQAKSTSPDKSTSTDKSTDTGNKK